MIRTILNRSVLSLALLAALAGLPGCQRFSGGNESLPEGQAAARVGKSELSIHQVNHLMQRQSVGPGADKDAAARMALDRLIVQELAVQQARTLELHRKPEVMMALEASQRDILAQAYLDNVAKDLPVPTDAEIGEFYDSRPLLFAERKVFLVQHIITAAPAAQLPAIQDALRKAPEFTAFMAELKAMGLHFSRTLAERGADMFPLDALPSIAKLSPGQALAALTPQGVHVYFMQSSRDEPLTLSQSRPVIEQYLSIERRRRALDERMTALRSTTPIQYLGPFSASAPRAGSGTASSAR